MSHTTDPQPAWCSWCIDYVRFIPRWRVCSNRGLMPERTASVEKGWVMRNTKRQGYQCIAWLTLRNPSPSLLHSPWLALTQIQVYTYPGSITPFHPSCHSRLRDGDDDMHNTVASPHLSTLINQNKNSPFLFPLPLTSVSPSFSIPLLYPGHRYIVSTLIASLTYEYTLPSLSLSWP